MTDIKKSILDKIKDGEIKQTSHWYFASRDYFFFFLSGCTAVLGMFAVSATIQRLFTEHMLGMKGVPLSMGYVKTSVLTFPYVWIVLFAVFCFIAWLNYHYTSSAYKQRNSLVIVAVVGASFVGGLLLFNFGVGERLDNSVRQEMPWYREHVERQDVRRNNFLRDMDPVMYGNRLNYINVRVTGGITYVALNPKCQAIRYVCKEGQEYYADNIGCGCKLR